VPAAAGLSSGSDVCAVSGTDGRTVRYTNAGSCVIDANQAGNASYAAWPRPRRRGQHPAPAAVPPLGERHLDVRAIDAVADGHAARDRDARHPRQAVDRITRSRGPADPQVLPFHCSASGSEAPSSVPYDVLPAVVPCPRRAVRPRGPSATGPTEPQ